MRKTLYYISILIITLSCSDKKTQKVNIKPEKIKSNKILETAVNDELEKNSDCIFDDNYKKITEEWLREVGIKKYVWDSKINKATFIYNGDTLIVSKGGCYHFISSVEIKTDKPENKVVVDSTILTKINDIACKFKFNNYCKKLTEGRFKKIENSNSSFFLEFEDDDPEDNLISEGIQILEKENRIIIKISEYYN